MNSNNELNPKESRRCGHGRRRWLKIPFVIAAIFIISGIFFYLWNLLIPDIFHGPEITYWQGMGLLVLSKMLFGSGFKKCCHGRRGRFGRNPWKNLSPEEREKILEGHRNRHDGSC